MKHFKEEVREDPADELDSYRKNEERAEYLPLELGTLRINSFALHELDGDEAWKMILRHQRGDWGEISTEDAVSNERALLEGGRVLSVYTGRRGKKVWIVTEVFRGPTSLYFLPPFRNN